MSVEKNQIFELESHVLNIYILSNDLSSLQKIPSSHSSNSGTAKTMKGLSQCTLKSMESLAPTPVGSGSGPKCIGS